MPSPLPGMDPWLEHPAIWPGVHQRLITYASEQLQEQVGERYVVEIGERVYLEAPERGVYPDLAVVAEGAPRPVAEGAARAELVPDTPRVVLLKEEERREPYLEVRDTYAGERVVAVIELLSPANKRPGPGRELYLRKQREALEAGVHLVEVDLLRAGEPTVALPPAQVGPEAYRVVVGRAHERGRRELYAFGVRDRLPRVAVPLLPPDGDAVLDLPTVFARTYDSGVYARRVDYAREPVPPLSAEDAEWARQRAVSG